MMAGRGTQTRPAADTPRAGLVHDGRSWVALETVGRYDARRSDAIPHAVPDGVDPARPANWRGYDAPELGDGLGGFLRAEPQTARAAALDDAYLLAGEELYRLTSPHETFEVLPIETDAEAERRRRLLERLREHEPTF